MLHYTQLYSSNQKSKPLRDATRNNLNLSKRNTKADISAPQYYSTARLRSNSSAGHSRTNLALYGTNLTNSNECYEKENNMTLTALAQNNLQILNEIDEDNFGRPKMFQTSIVPSSKSSANLLQKKLHLENFYYRKGSDTRPQTTLSSSRRYHIEPAEDQDSLLGSRKVTLYNRDINATLLSNQKSMSIVDMQLNTQNSNAPSLYSRFTKNCATPQQQKNAGNKSLVSLKPAIEAEAARRESFINKIQQNLVKNKMNTTIQNNDKKRSSNAFNDEVTKKHLAKISKMTAAISHIPEKKKSIPSHFLLKDLCSGMDNTKVVMDSTLQKEPTLESLSNSQVRQRRLSGNRTMQNSPPKILTERPSGVNIFHLVRNFQQYNEVKKELNASTAKAAPTTATQTQTLDCYKFDRLLGQGSYAIVKLATERATGVQVAIKTYEKQKLTDPRKMKNVRREISILKETNHPNVIKLHCSFETSKQIHLVMEYVGKTSLYSYLKTKTGRQVGENEARRMFVQLCSGMSYVHAKKIVHRDLKLENILLDDNNNIKIIDFGFSICIDPETKLNIFCGTPSYMAPEIIAKLNYKGSPADVWALGILLYTMLCGKFPFRGFDEKDLFNKIKKGKFDIPLNLGSDARHLLEKILKVNPSERPTVDEILKDKWFQQ